MKLASQKNYAAQPKTIKDGIISEQALADFKVGRLDEGFETDKADIGELHEFSSR